MRLLGEFACVLSDRVTECGHDYELRFNPEHFIYGAHFPGEPVTPGVCILQLALELLERHTGESLEISSVKNVKFLRTIVPSETPSLCFSIRKAEIDGDLVRAQMIAVCGEEVYARLSLICRKVCNSSAIA